MTGTPYTRDEWPPLTSRILSGFPVDALPTAIATWVRAVAEQAQAPADLPAISALGTLAGAAIGAPRLDLGNREEELGLYLLAVLPSGERKSTVLRPAMAPLLEIEQEARERAARR